VSNTCRQCATLNDCPVGSFGCTNNQCNCRLPNSANVIKDGNFDTSTTLTAWTRQRTTWSSDDSDGCPGSGSVTIPADGMIERCFQVSTDGQSRAYVLGFHSRLASNGAGCFGGFYSDSACSTPAGGADFLNAGAGGPSSAWTSIATQVTAPTGTRFISVQCSGMGIDRIFLRPAPVGVGF
jgi:hypothetical protein